MYKLQSKDFASYLLVALATLSYIFGFYFDENAAGGGGYKGDITLIYSNVQLFLENDIITATTHFDYASSRLPGIYIFHKLFNPFVDNVESYRKSIFFISFLLPILFFLCLKKNFKEASIGTLLLVSSTIFLSPYFRTSAFWGLEENLSLIFVLLSYLSVSYFLNNTKLKFTKKLICLFLVTFLSSLTFYFDSKLIIIPFLCFVKIILSNEEIKTKFVATIFYCIFSIPALYTFVLWGGIMPVDAQESRLIGEKFFPEHVGYAMSIIAFYSLPILFFKKNIVELLKGLFLDRINLYLIFIFVLYVISLTIFFNFEEQSLLGKGIIFKLSNFFFNDLLIQQFFTYLGFIISWIIILLILDKKIINVLYLGYFIVFSFISYPIYHEYFDPLVVLMLFTYLKTSLKINQMASYVVFTYLLFVLISADIYYYKLLN
jgi:hypothetical protein|tara:strand:- start:743 stop:2038 length:1296 start_codon:yes stop_codon:yes gene_type:complete